ncbi:MAG TPA: hypothetical protein VLN46_03695 [Gillisia sp.]|nr:hypothetical protein [Gillisia sp.]
MGYREEILIQLYRILENNISDARIYYRLADKCKRSSIKNFFKKLSLQKRIFCRRIKYEIGELERQMEQIGEKSGSERWDSSKKTFHNLPSLGKDITEMITYCDKRERQYLELYKTLLSKTNIGNIREMLLSQKHAVQLALNEMKTLETKIHNSKNEEINYS